MVDANDRTGQGGRHVEPAAGPVSVSDPAEARAYVLAAYEEHGPELRRFVLGVVRDPDAAGDVMQAALSKALELGHTARPETFKGWLFRVAFHEALAARRRHQAGAAAVRRLADLGLAATSGAARPDEGLIRVETVEAVRRALGDLPDEQRRVVVARVYGDQTFAQIANDAGLPLGTVLTRMRLALKKLRHALRPAAGDGD